jgi:ligand-binding SRPBCC domain-containing protein
MVEAVNRTTALPAAATEVWERVVSPEGINDEMGPWMKMTMPRSMRGKTIADVEPGQRIGRSWILLFGLIPFDYDDLGLAELEPGRRFLERSTMLSMRRWEHERTVAPSDGGCAVTDRVSFELRRPLAAFGLTRPIAAMIGRFFAHRHRRLVARFG